MKRTAQKQLIKDDDPEEESEEGTQGLRKADDAVLATRKIRGLPKRAGASPAPAPATNGTAEPPADKPKFGGFGGFGGFGASAPAPAAPAADKPKFGGFTGFGGFGSSAPAAPSAASNATKTFASLVSSTKPSPSPSSTSTPTNAPPPPPEPQSTTNGSPDAAVKYYTSLRGLNASFVKALTSAVDEDPFRDISGLLEQYRQHRVSVQSEYDSTATAGGESSAGTGTPPASKLPTPPGSFSGWTAPPSSAALSQPPTVPSFTPPAPPKPPSGGFSFGGSSVPASTSTSTPKPAAGGFAPDFSAAPAAKAGSFSFPAFGSKPEAKDSESVEKTEAKEETKAPPPTFGSSFKSGPIAPTLFGSSSSSSTSNPFAPSSSLGSGASASLFGVSAASTPAIEKSGFSFAPSSSDKAPSTGFSFGAKQMTPGKSAFGGFGSATGDASPPASRTPPVGFSFGGPMPKFDLGSTTASKDEGEKKEEEEGGEKKTAGGFSFGAASGGGGGAFGSSSTGAFGSASGGFGSSSGSGAFKPFGSSSPFGSSTSGFSFGKPAASSAEGTASPESAATPAPEGDEDSGAGGGKDYDTVDDAPGAEPTVHRVRAKVYRFRAAQGEKEAGWNEVGVGFLRVRKNDDTSKRSLFLRNSSTGRVVFNFLITATMAAPTVSKRSVTFIGFAEGENKPSKFMLRTGKEHEAAEAGRAIEREIEFVKGHE